MRAEVVAGARRIGQHANYWRIYRQNALLARLYRALVHYGRHLLVFAVWVDDDRRLMSVMRCRLLLIRLLLYVNWQEAARRLSSSDRIIRLADHHLEVTSIL